MLIEILTPDGWALRSVPSANTVMEAALALESSEPFTSFRSASTYTVDEVKANPSLEFRVYTFIKYANKCGGMWWTWSAATAHISDAVVFSYATVSPICRGPLEHSTVTLVANNPEVSYGTLI